MLCDFVKWHSPRAHPEEAGPNSTAQTAWAGCGGDRRPLPGTREWHLGARVVLNTAQRSWQLPTTEPERACSPLGLAARAPSAAERSGCETTLQNGYVRASSGPVIPRRHGDSGRDASAPDRPAVHPVLWHCPQKGPLRCDPENQQEAGSCPAGATWSAPQMPEQGRGLHHPDLTA